MIYFDNAATTRPYEEVVKTYARLSEEIFGNPSSPNGLGLKASEYLEKARAQIKRTLKLGEEFELVFTSGATESNNLAIRGYALRHQKEGRHLITTCVEHPSVENVFRELEKESFKVTYLPVDGEGRISLENLKEVMDEETTLVSVMGVNNEVGTVFPLTEISRIVHAYPHAVLMSDLTQRMGKEEVPYPALDLFSMSGHKVKGLKSSGLLGIRKGLLLDPVLLGGEQEYGERPGTINVPLCCSLATALRLYIGSYDERRAKAQEINSYLREELGKRDDLTIVSPEDATPFILNFALKRTKASVLIEALSDKEIYVSTRSACSSHAKGGSSVLLAMGYPEFLAENAVRLSFEGTESMEDARNFITALNTTLDELKTMK